jgi:hypothetical protein
MAENPRVPPQEKLPWYQWQFPEGLADVVISTLAIAILSFMALVCWNLSQRGELAAFLATGVLGPPGLITALAYGAVYLGFIRLAACLVQAYARTLWRCLRSQAGSPYMTADRFINSVWLLGGITFLLMSAVNVTYSTAMLRLAHSETVFLATAEPSKTVLPSSLSVPQSVTSPCTTAQAQIAPVESKKGNSPVKGNSSTLIFLAGVALPVALLGAWWTIKNGLFLVAVARSRTEHTAWWHPEEKTSVSLLPSQWGVLEKLWEVLSSKYADKGHGGIAYALKGSWGTGKSFLLHQMERSMAAPDMQVKVYHGFEDIEGALKPVPVGIDKIPYVKVQGWSEETELDLQFSILRGLLLHPSVLFKPLWSTMLTPGLVVQILIRRLKCWFRQLRVKTAAIEMDISLGVPLPWQKYLEKIASLSKCGFMVVLEEIDRATPSMAQVAVTMIRRSLDKPGITVIVPYVPEQIRYKVFNPLLCETTDLQSSIMADLWNDLLRDRNPHMLRDRLSFSPFDDDENEQKRITKRSLISAVPGTKSSSSMTKKTKRQGGVSPTESLPDSERLRQGLSAWYLQRLSEHGEGMYEQFCDRFEEKFLSRSIIVEAVSATDIPMLIRSVPSLWQHFDKNGLPLPGYVELTAACKKLEKQANRSEFLTAINLRELIGALEGRLIVLKRHSPTRQDVIAVIALEYYRIVRAGGRLEMESWYG